MNILAMAVATLLLCVNAQAQVRKCTGADGHVTYSQTECGTSAKTSQSIAVQKFAHPSPAVVEKGQVKPRSQLDSIRQETIRLMISNGKLDEAAAYANTPAERAIVAKATPPKPRRKVTPTSELIDRTNAVRAKSAKDMADVMSKAYKR